MKRLKKADLSREEIRDELSKLQSALHDEKEAISLYKSYSDESRIPEIKTKLIEIMKEEEHHAVELQELINKYILK